MPRQSETGNVMLAAIYARKSTEQTEEERKAIEKGGAEWRR